MFRVNHYATYSAILCSGLMIINNCFYSASFGTNPRKETYLDSHLNINNPELIANQKQLRHRVGEFQIIYKPSPNELHQALQNFLKESGIFETIIKGLNNSGLVMRVDIPVIFQDCGFANAFYNPQNQSITMCHELVFEMATDFIELKKVTRKEGLKDAIFTSLFVFFHELGHALIDILSLPAVGKEEDSVDQFAALIFLNTEEPDVTINTVLNAAFWFGNSPEIPAWDEHAPSDVRFFYLVCLIYGSDPNQYASLLKILPQERADECPIEYKKIAASWEKLLLPHFAEVNRPWGSPSRLPATRPVTRPPRGGRIW